MPVRKVFVYGTLKKGYDNHALLQGSKFIGVAVVANHILYGSTIPFAVENKSSHITGEVYEIDDVTEKNLDKLEGYPGWYDKKIVETGHGRAIMYYVDKHAVAGLPLIGSVFRKNSE